MTRVGVALGLVLAACAPNERAPADKPLGQGRRAPQVDAGAAVIALDVGTEHSCALMADRSVRCWGSNAHGELTGDRTAPPDHSFRPIAVPHLPSAAELAAGAQHNCVRAASGEVRCWGSDEVALAGRAGLAQAADALALGERATCALRWGFAPRCFGAGGMGRFPAHVPVAARGPDAPMGLQGVPPPTQVVFGGEHGCALMPDGTVWCWRGSGEVPPRPVAPETVIGLRGVQQLSASAGYTCALKVEGKVWCWGDGERGTLGVAERERLPIDAHGRHSSDAPVPVAALDNAVQIDAGGSHACAVTRTGKVFCWGFNGVGQLGNASTQNSDVPVEVAGVADAVQVVASPRDGSAHSCALSRRGQVWCWGHNEHGQCGDGSTEDRAQPVAVIF